LAAIQKEDSLPAPTLETMPKAVFSFGVEIIIALVKMDVKNYTDRKNKVTF